MARASEEAEVKLAIIGDATGIADRAADAGLEVLCFATSEGEGEALEGRGHRLLEAWTDFSEALEAPRIYLLDLPLGERLDAVIDEGSAVMEPGDVLVDPGGSWWCDTLRRYRRLRHRALYFVDVALFGEGEAALLLASGDPSGVDIALPALRKLIAPGRAQAFGSAGAAHYARMVGDGVATALAQAHSEAVQLMEAWPGEADLEVVRSLWPFEDMPPAPRDSWLLDDAVRLEAAVPLLAQAVMLRLAERLDAHSSEPPAPRVGGFGLPEDIR